MKWIGLTGGIATGKSTVAQILKKSGYPIVDADTAAKEVVARGTECFNKIVKSFGRTIVQDDGELNRKELGRIVFSDRDKRFELEKIVHPYVQERVRKIRTELESKGHKIAFYDVPLLFEKGLEKQFDATVVVASSAQAQLQRLKTRDGFDTSQASARIASQLPVSQKTALADYIIWNDGTLKDLEFQVNEFLDKLTKPTNIRK